MDPLSKLPVECLHLILKSLADEDLAGSLATLLQTNKHIATVTLPFLYADPFQDSFHHATDNGVTRTDHILARMLLGKLPGTEFTQLCQSQNLLPAYTKNLGSGMEILRCHYHVFLHRQANWSLANPILEQLQSLIIPVSDLERYSHVMDRLGSLEHLRFSLDVVASYDYYYDEDDEDDNGNDIISAEFRIALQARRAELSQAMVQFVKDHTRLFPGRLRTVASSDSEMWPDLKQACPEETELEILQMLPPLKKPTSLTTENSLHFSVHLKSTDLCHVREIPDFHSSSFNPWFGTLRDNRQFLQRCRALRSLSMDTLGQGTFKWAVQEKRELEDLGNNTTSNIHKRGQGILSLEELRPAYLKHGLVPLEDVCISEVDEPLTDEIDDVAFAFSQTLQSFIVTPSYEQLQPPRSLHVGQGWVDLPALTYLSIDMRWNQLIVDQHLLNRCPSLKDVTLADNTSRYQCEDIVTCLPADVTSLKTLNLTGWSALTFHPDTLHSTVSLWELTVMVENVESGDYFIPSIEELDRSFGIQDDSADDASTQATSGIVRPLWTWDWQLPLLGQVTLTGEFAYRFQFRMLQGCPALEILDLNIQTADGQHIRTISGAELFLPGTGNIEDPTGAPSQQPIVAPALQTLRLTGRWVIADALLPQLLGHTCPKLESLEEDGMSGYTLKGLVEVIKTMPNNMKEWHSNMVEPSEESAAELGLHAYDEDVSEEMHSRLVDFYFLDWVMLFILKDVSPEQV
ncbi:hypothetical protein BGX33_004837 [Mortierella sp. NVP41]|nr:hypothetical protein BGX33_004837 [Mortierella sp. NVP41]